MERRIYLNNTDIDEAVALYLEKTKDTLSLIKKETIDIREAAGRITGAPIFARLSSPNHNAAAMDGIMVISAATFNANEKNPIILKRGLDFEYINTGHLIKEPYDSVIMIEDVVPVQDLNSKESSLSMDSANDEQPSLLRIMVQASPWQHIRPIGEDLVSGEMILPENHKIRPMDIGAVLSGGITDIEVYEKIKVAILPTGNEITDSYSELECGKTFDTNSWTFKAIIESFGAKAHRVSPVEDDYELLKLKIKSLLSQNHMLVINAGSSAGSKDYTASLIEDLGEVVLHGIAIKPGKPTILGKIDGKPVIGVPGYPGSAFLVFEEIVGPILSALMRQPVLKKEEISAVISKRIVSSLKYREYIRVKLGKVGEKLIATPLNRGAGVNMALVKADGLLIVPKSSEGYDAGSQVSVELLTPMEVIENTVVSIGSHDLIIDYMDNILMKNHEKYGKVAARLSSAHVGSMGGIMALKRGEAHVAPIHLLDEETGVYNEAVIEKYLKSENVKLIKGVKRQQGFILPKGNPKNILSIEDIRKDGVVFVNRQKGSGTRVLTDYLLKKAGIAEKEVLGYDREMTTHMAVAAAVKSGSADVGVGVYSAAKAMELDFIFIGDEDYDFAIPEKYLKMPSIEAFIQVLDNPEFLEILIKLGGYTR